MVPAHPRQPAAVRTQARRGIEVGSPHQGTGRRGAIQVEGDERVDRLTADNQVILTHPDPAPPARIHDAVGITKVPVWIGRIRRRWGDGFGRGAGMLAIEPLVEVMAEVGHAGIDRVSAAAILVDARADIEGRRSHIGRSTSCVPAHQDVAAAFPRPAFEPVNIIAIEPDVRQGDRLRDDQVGSDGRRPGTVGSRSDFCHGGGTLSAFMIGSCPLTPRGRGSFFAACGLA